jgi:hypothetical protein
VPINGAVSTAWWAHVERLQRSRRARIAARSSRDWSALP